MRRFGNGHDAALQVPTQNDLRNRLAVLRADLCKNGLDEQSASALAEWRPCFMDDTVLVHPFVCGFLLIVRMRLHLIDHRFDARKGTNVHQPVGIEVGNADGAQFSLRIQLLQRSPCAVVICKRLMQQNEVEIIVLQFTQRFQD